MNAGQTPSNWGGQPISVEPPPSRVVSVKLPTVRPVVTYVLLSVCVVVFIAQYASNILLGGDLPAVWGAKVNEWIVRGELWRLLTPMFLHADIIHIAFNMFGLIRFGPALERHYGHWRFLILFLLGGFAGNVASFIMTPNPSLGSSTAIFGLLGAEAVFLYQNRKLFGRLAQQDLIYLILLAGYNLVYGFTGGGLIDNWGHIGGLVGGTLFAWFGGPQLAVEGLFPSLTVVDRRETRQAVIAGLFVGMLFAILAGATIVMRSLS